MLYSVNLNREELFMAKNGLASLFTFYMVKKLTKFSNGNLCLLRREREEGYTSRQILLKNSKINCGWS